VQQVSEGGGGGGGDDDSGDGCLNRRAAVWNTTLYMVLLNLCA
jgi:hypothetical protein